MFGRDSPGREPFPPCFYSRPWPGTAHRGPALGGQPWGHKQTQPVNVSFCLTINPYICSINATNQEFSLLIGQNPPTVATKHQFQLNANKKKQSKAKKNTDPS